MATPDKSIHPLSSFESFCDWGIVFSLCAAVFVLPAAIAYLDSFVGFAIFLYILKKMTRTVVDWPARTLYLNLLGKAHFVWKGFAPPANILDVPLQFLALAVLVSALFSQYPALSLLAFFGKFLKCIFLYFSFIEAFRDERKIRIFLYCFMASAFITALSGLFQHYTGKDFLKGRLIGTENFISTERISSSFFGANGFGAYLLTVIGLAAHLLYTAVVHKKRWILGGVLAIFLVLLLTCLCWTYSRSSWIGYLAILFVMLLLDRRKVFLVVPLVLVLVIIFLPSLNNVRHQNLINDNNTGVQKSDGFKSVLEKGGSGRITYWKKAIAIIRTSPVWGTGLNTYTRIMRKDTDPGTWPYAHNCYLQMAAEIGLVGLACFLWLLFVLLRHALDRCKKMKELWPQTFLQGSVSGLCGFMVQSFFDNTFYTVQLGVLMWLIFGLIISVERLNPIPSKSS